MELAELLYRALDEPVGLAVRCVNPAAIKAKLYALRKEDPSLSVLSITPSRIDPDNEIWIVKKAPPNGKG